MNFRSIFPRPCKAAPASKHRSFSPKAARQPTSRDHEPSYSAHLVEEDLQDTEVAIDHPSEGRQVRIKRLSHPVLHVILPRPSQIHLTVFSASP